MAGYTLRNMQHNVDILDTTSRSNWLYLAGTMQHNATATHRPVMDLAGVSAIQSHPDANGWVALTMRWQNDAMCITSTEG